MLDFTLEFFGHGWAWAKLSNDNENLDLVASYLSDGMRDLVIAVRLLLDSNTASVCKWQNEPGERRWLFNSDGSNVMLNIFEFDNEFSNLDDSQGKIIFTANTDLIKLPRKLSSEMELLLNEHGEEGYLKTWGYEFPHKELNVLRKLIREYKAEL